MTSNLTKPGRRVYGRNPIAEWLRFAINDPELITVSPCTMLALVRTDKGVEEEVYSSTLEGSKWTPEELADKFYQIAKENCKDEPGVEHRYRMLAFYGNNEPKSHKGFALSPYGETVDYLNEAPDNRGAQAQGMRLLETMAQGTFAILKHTTAQIAAENSELRKENRDMFGVMKEMMIEMANNAHRVRMEEMAYDRATSERKILMGFAPALINNLLGKDIFPQSTSDTALINTIADNITEEQIQKLANSAEGLPATVWGPLAMRIHTAMKEKRELKDKIKVNLKLVQGSKNPEDDAAGD